MSVPHPVVAVIIVGAYLSLGALQGLTMPIENMRQQASAEFRRGFITTQPRFLGMTS